MHSHFSALLRSSFSISCARHFSTAQLRSRITCITSFTKVKSTPFPMSCAALCPFCGFAFPLGRRPIGLLVSLFDASVGASHWFLCFFCVPPWIWEGPAFFAFVFGSCWLLFPSAVASPPPAVGPVWCPGPVFTLVPPSGYLVAAVTAQLPCFRAGSVVVLCRPSVNCLMAAKAIKPCVGCFTLSTMLQVMSGSSV